MSGVKHPVILRTGETLEPVKVAVTLSTDALPEATVTLAEDPGAKLHDLVEIFTGQGSAGLFRVTDRAKAYDGETELKLRGALDTLSDDVYPGTDALTGTATAVLTDILSKQSAAKWQLGTCALTGDVKIENSYTNLYDLLDAVRQARSGYWWVCNYATTPWTVSLQQLPATLAAEFRLGRNVESATIDLSDAEMCTRLYMTVSTDSSSTLYTYNDAAAQAEWGVITKTVDVPEEECPDPAATGAAILAERGQPVAFITISGYDLQRLTGDAFDRITLGSNCRVVLEDFGGTFTERVTRIQWPDAVGEPEKISVSLANNLTNFSEQLKLVKKGGGGTAKKVEEQQRELVRHRADISKTDERILLWATEEEWDDLAQQYTTTRKSGFEVNSEQILARVEIGQVATQLTVEVGNVSVSNGNLVVDGYVTASSFNGLEAEFDNLTTGLSTATALNALSIYASGTLSCGDTGITLGGVYWRPLSKTLADGTTIYYLGHT